MTNYELLVNGTDYQDNILYFKVINELGEIPFFEAKFIYELNSTSDFSYNNSFILKYDGSYYSNLFKIIESKPTSSYEYYIKGYDWSAMLLSDFKIDTTASSDSDSQGGRPQYTNQTFNTIFTEQKGLYSDLSGINITQTNFPSDLSSYATVRGEADSLLIFFANVCSSYGFDWWFTLDSVSPASNEPEFNYGTQGTDLSGSITLNLSGANKNCTSVERNKNYNLLVNEATVYGYGDGINQLESKSFHATSIRSKLSSDLSKTNTTSMSLSDASSFPSSGNVWVGCEKITYTGKSGNTLTGLTRGVAFQGNVDEAYAHTVNSPVYDAQYTVSSPQSSGDGSSINTHGRKQEIFDKKKIIDQSTLDIIAESILLERKGNTTDYDPPETIIVEADVPETMYTSIEVGDTVNVVDSITSLNSTFRINKLEFIYDTGLYVLKIYLSNLDVTLMKELKQTKSQTDTLSKYMQGATNIFSINETDNIESGTDKGIELFFDIPNDAVAINSVKLSYRNESPRIWTNLTTEQTELNRTIDLSSGTYSVNLNDDTWTNLNTSAITFTNDLEQVLFGLGVYSQDWNKDLVTDVDSFDLSIDFDGSSWYDIETISMLKAKKVNCFANFSEYASADAGFSIYLRLKIGDSSPYIYYPSSTGIEVAEVDLNTTSEPWSASGFLSYDFTEKIVGIEDTTDFVLQAKIDASTTVSSVSVNGACYVSKLSAEPWGNENHNYNLYFRILNDTDSEYYPNSTGVNILDEKIYSTFSTFGLIVSNKNLKNKLLYFQLKSETYDLDYINITRYVYGTKAHTHGVNYDINTQSYTTTDIRIFTSDDADGTPTWTERTSAIESTLGRSLRAGNTQVETNIPLSSYFSGIGFKGIKIVGNGNSRHKAQVTTKCYVQSRLKG